MLGQWDVQGRLCGRSRARDLSWGGVLVTPHRDPMALPALGRSLQRNYMLTAAVPLRGTLPGAFSSVKARCKEIKFWFFH